MGALHLTCGAVNIACYFSAFITEVKKIYTNGSR